LLERIRVALRHVGRTGTDATATTYTVSDLKVDLALRRVWSANKEVHLTPIEYKLLTEPVRHAGKVLTHGFLN
jgi:two-component system KDP operon response regulator KdpE